MSPVLPSVAAWCGAFAERRVSKDQRLDSQCSAARGSRALRQDANPTRSKADAPRLPYVEATPALAAQEGAKHYLGTSGA
eukprot:scaffold2952_cov312-Pinguiococcus_pyrenoidosus.AAC.24